MKSEDESEQLADEDRTEEMKQWIMETQRLLIEHLTRRVQTLEKGVKACRKQITRLETQRTPADANMDDPEWY